MKITSISGKLQAGFLAVAGIGAIVGAIALVALDRVGDATSRLVRDELPIAESTGRTHVAALNIVGSVRLFLASREGLGARRDGVARDLKQLDASLDALAAVIERTRRDDLSGAIRDLRQEARQLTSAGTSVMQSHEHLTAYGFTFDERVYTVVTFGHFLRAQLARWISDLGDAARFDAPFKHSLDPATTSFERWRAQYQTSDAELAKLLDGYARTNAAIHADAKRIQEADGTSAKASHFERARARNFGRAERELDAIIEHGGKATLALEREAAERLAALDVIAARIVTRLTELTDSVGKRVATMSGDAIALGSTAKIVGIIAVLIGFSISALLAAVLGRGLARPLASLRNVMERLTQGDLSVDVPGRERADEIGAMAKSVDLLKASALERQTLAAAAAKEQASRLERARRIEALTAQFEESASKDVRLATEAADNMLAVASEMSGSATQTNQHVGSAASATSAASADASTIAAALTEFSASIKTITSSVEGSSQVVRQAVEEVARTGETFSTLSEGASRIGEVVRLISSIAGQTNLLALNAAIEAARAGEAGKGFAVVAGEVKALASQTARATDDIARQISAIQGAVADAVTAMEGIGQTIGKLDNASAEISQSVAQQGQTTAELSQSTNNAATSVDNAARAVDAVKERAQETHELARSVTAAGEVLRGTAADLGRRIGEFTAQIKAA